MLKGFIPIIILSLFLILPSFAQQTPQQCQLATPRYGVVNCVSTPSYVTETVALSINNDQSEGRYTCVTNCEINNLPIPDCGFGWNYHWEVILDGVNTVYKKSSWIGGEQGGLPISFTRGSSAVVKGWCRSVLTQKKPLPLSSITVRKQVWRLQEGWAGSLPDVPVPETEDCVVHKVVERYKKEPDVTTFLNPSSERTETKLSGTYSDINSAPTSWKEGDSYIFVKDWQTGIASISLTYDKQNRAYWCGGLLGSRKIYNVDNVISGSGTCYSIPKSIVISNIECCFPSDCLSKDPSGKLTCNPDTWKCEETKPCNSDLDCQQTFGAGICQNKQVTSWVCDTNKKWGNYAGTCIKQTKTVLQCPNECKTNEYYNDEEGKCKSRITLVDCPAGKCCKSGGNYKEKICESGLQCCPTADPIVGECKQTCEPVEQKSLGQNISGGVVTGQVTASPFDVSGGILIAVVLGLVAAGGGVGYYLFIRKPTIGSKTVVKHCTKCGTKTKGSLKFCTRCGKKS